MTEKIKFISIGLGGCGLEISHSSRVSDYCRTPEAVAEKYSERLDTGVYLIDKRPVVTKNPMHAFASPLVNVDLEAWDSKDSFKQSLADCSITDELRKGAYGTLLALADEFPEDTPGPLDYVPIDYYVNWWREKGALVYVFDGVSFVKEG